ncbi:MAG: RNA-binding protein [Myxococcota bacterium]
MNIYVGNLAYQVTEEELKSTFSAFGEVESVRIITDRDTNRSKGFGFVEMPKREEALAAIEGLNGTELGERQITVNEARPKPQRDNRGGGYRGGGRNRY